MEITFSFVISIAPTSGEGRIPHNLEPPSFSKCRALADSMAHFTVATLSALRPTGTLGPFGLAFPAEIRAEQLLTCDSLRGRPFITAVHIERVHAPFGGRERYEFRIQCGPANSSWSALGPALLPWAVSRVSEVSCPRPQSATGFLVSRGRTEWTREDHFSFSLLCGVTNTLVDDHGLDRPVSIDESRGRKCPDASFMSGLRISRGFERAGHCLAAMQSITRNVPCLLA